MSASKKSRFEGLPVVNTPAQIPAAGLRISEGGEAKREALSTLIRPDLKVALKQASAKEKRKVYQLLEDGLEEYLKRHHPDLLDS